MHIGRTCVSINRRREHDLEPCILTTSRYFAKKLLFGAPFHDGGMLHNNPSAIASREGTVLWRCSAADNLLVSVGCGDLRVDSSGDSSVSRLWNAFAQKLRPAKEEEIRALWGADRCNYERLDPILDIAEIPLDNLRTMLFMLPDIKSSMHKSEDLREKMRRTAWKLIAASFYVPDIRVERARKQLRLKLQIRCRLDQDAWRIWRRWPDAHLSIDGKLVRPTQERTSFNTHVTCIPVGHTVDLRLDASGHSASVSGFPMPVSAISQRQSCLESASVLGKRKRV